MDSDLHSMIQPDAKDVIMVVWIVMNIIATNVSQEPVCRWITKLASLVSILATNVQMEINIIACLVNLLSS